jgi:maleate isomerase
LVAPFDFVLDRECWRWLPSDIDLHITRTPHLQNTAVTVAFAKELSDKDTLTTAVKALSHMRDGATIYACTSGSFVNGVEGEKELQRVMVESGAQEPVTTSGALITALNYLGIKSLATVTPYGKELTESLNDFVEDSGINVQSSIYLNKQEGIGQIGYETVRSLAYEVDCPEADALFISCTNLRTFDLIEELEAVLDKPVLSANQVMIWAALNKAKFPFPDVNQRLFKPRPMQELLPTSFPSNNEVIFLPELPSAS